MVETKEQNYTRSNSILNIPNLSLDSITKTFYRTVRDMSEVNETALQLLSDLILKDLGLDPITVSFNGRRPHSRNDKRVTRETHGVHKSNYLISSIRIYSHTAARQQLVSAKSAVSTLLHEINHEIDKRVLKLNSIHSKGFYSRLKHLTISME